MSYELQSSFFADGVNLTVKDLAANEKVGAPRPHMAIGATGGNYLVITYVVVV